MEPSCTKHVEQVVVVPPCHLALGGDPDFDRGILLEQIQSQMLNQQMLTRLETNPTDPKLLWRLFQWTTRTLYKS